MGEKPNYRGFNFPLTFDEESELTRSKCAGERLSDTVASQRFAQQHLVGGDFRIADRPEARQAGFGPLGDGGVEILQVAVRVARAIDGAG